MKRIDFLANRYWAAGVLLASLGVLLARCIAPMIAAKSGAVVAALGEVIAIAGLFIIAVGIRRRVSDASTRQTAPDQAPVG